MIQANELRIGNIVEYNHHTDMLGMVTWIQKTSIEVTYFKRCEEDLSNGAIVSPEFLIPIPLTPDVLRNIEEPRADGWVYLTKYLRVCCADGSNLCNLSMGFSETGKDKIDWYIILLPVYLHQLQNAVFSLIGTEIIYNPTSIK